MWRCVELVAVLGLECLEVGLNTISKASMVRGVNNFVLTTYSTAIGVLFLLPLAFIYHRNANLTPYSLFLSCGAVTPPKLTFSIVCRIFILGFIGYFVTILSYIGIGYSSPTIASAMNNLTPAFTFILARITRMEKLDLKSKSSQAKFIGTTVSVVGALTVTLYKGPTIFLAPQISSSTLRHTFESSTQTNWVLGGFILAASSFSLALLIILQTWIVKDYSSEVTIALIGAVFSTIISTVASLIIVKEPNEWRLHSKLELITILYSAIFMVVCRNVIIAWVLRKKGPVFLTMFKPLDMIIAIVMGITFLGDGLYLGSMMGAMLIALGFYSVLWGKVDEEKVIEDTETRINSNSSFDRLPLLNKAYDN